MHADAVVEDLQIFEDGLPGVFPARVHRAFHQFQFQRREEALGHGVVVRHARPAHAQRDFRCLRFCPIPGAGVLAAAIMMQEQAGRRAALLQGHRQGALGQVDTLVIIHRPAHDATAVGIDDHGQQ